MTKIDESSKFKDKKLIAAGKNKFTVAPRSLSLIGTPLSSGESTKALQAQKMTDWVNNNKKHPMVKKHFPTHDYMAGETIIKNPDKYSELLNHKDFPPEHKHFINYAKAHNLCEGNVVYPMEIGSLDEVYKARKKMSKDAKMREVYGVAAHVVHTERLAMKAKQRPLYTYSGVHHKGNGHTGEVMVQNYGEKKDRPLTHDEYQHHANQAHKLGMMKEETNIFAIAEGISNLKISYSALSCRPILKK